MYLSGIEFVDRATITIKQNFHKGYYTSVHKIPVSIFTNFILVLLLTVALTSCKDQPTKPEDVSVDPGVTVDIHVDEGYTGLVIDTRQIKKKGYNPTTAIINFLNFPNFDTSLTINTSTNIAILQFHNPDLTEEEMTAFGNGIAADISIMDDSQNQLTDYHDNSVVLDDSNIPLNLTTSLPYISHPLIIDENIPYLLQPEGMTGVETTTCPDCYEPRDYMSNNFTQQFYFTKVQGGDPNTYNISHPAGYPEGDFWYMQLNGNSDTGWVNLTGGANTFTPGEFILEQDDDGWIKIKDKTSGLYIHHWSDLLTTTMNGAQRWRLISDHINWQVVDKGTVYHQPIMPPAQLDFAYSGTLRNCSSATLEESIGKTDSRTRTTTAGTSESLQLFSQNQLSLGVKVGYQVKAKVGNENIGSEEETFSAELNTSYTYTTSSTSTSENTWSQSQSETVEVSRVRTITLQPYTAVEAYDAVKTVKNIKLPFTQILRIRGNDTQTGAALSGDELVTQMSFNLMSGTITNVAADYIDVAIRGFATMDQLFKASTEVKEIVNGCN